ncbi:hypothetical protein K438DRAFT_1803106 [Mycena galopus ATCC 62051]|nr:hypothetical protein K438DRAFT_1803106 [Mycena galopus ATCC 62051]
MEICLNHCESESHIVMASCICFCDNKRRSLSRRDPRGPELRLRPDPAAALGLLGQSRECSRLV